MLANFVNVYRVWEDNVCQSCRTPHHWLRIAWTCCPWLYLLISSNFSCLYQCDGVKVCAEVPKWSQEPENTGIQMFLGV